jgi:hypothetical protein
MNRLSISTRGIGSWRDRLANPQRQWKQHFSALEAAVSWEVAGKRASGLPLEIENCLQQAGYADPDLLTGMVEHKVPLGPRTPSQCDVWALIKTSKGRVSMSVEAKVNEGFGNETLGVWLQKTSPAGIPGRQTRWNYIQSHLPPGNSFQTVKYQILHRCATAVIEARRWDVPHAAFIVQAFQAPHHSYQDFSTFCQAINLAPARNTLLKTQVGNVTLGIGWLDFNFATPNQIAKAI